MVADEVVGEQREAGVVEGGHRVEDPEPHGTAERFVVGRPEAQAQQRRHERHSIATVFHSKTETGSDDTENVFF